MSQTWDVVVVGGGIHGAGVAQAGAARGWSVLVLEQGEIAGATSSNSSKLIHGGLRYLETFQLKLVRECLRERHYLLRNAPTLVKLQPFYIPVYRSSRRSALWIRLGLSLYALLGGLRRHARFAALPRAMWSRMGGLRTEGLVKVFRYYDGQTDDAALTRAVFASARSLGAQVRERTRLVRALRAEDHYHLLVENEREIIRCRALVNTAGPWVDAVAARMEPAPPRPPVNLVQGAHIVLPFKAPAQCYYLESPDDGRALFALPWRGQTMIGTTERPFTGDPSHCEASSEEIDYLLHAYNHYFGGAREASREDVVRTFAGVRVLPAGEGEANRRSRETVFVESVGQPLYLGVYGGKLTSYRATAEKVARRLAHALPRRHKLARTEQLPLERESDGGVAQPVSPP